MCYLFQAGNIIFCPYTLSFEHGNIVLMYLDGVTSLYFKITKIMTA